MNLNCFLHFHTFCLSLTSHSIASSFSWWHRVEVGGAYWFSRQTPVDFWGLFHSIGAPLGLQCGKWAHPIAKGNEKKPFSDEISYIFSFFSTVWFFPPGFLTHNHSVFKESVSHSLWHISMSSSFFSFVQLNYTSTAHICSSSAWRQGFPGTHLCQFPKPLTFPLGKSILVILLPQICCVLIIPALRSNNSSPCTKAKP